MHYYSEAQGGVDIAVARRALFSRWPNFYIRPQAPDISVNISASSTPQSETNTPISPAQQYLTDYIGPLYSQYVFRGKHLFKFKPPLPPKVNTDLRNHAVLKEGHSCPCGAEPSIHFVTRPPTCRPQGQQYSFRPRCSSCRTTPSRSHACQA